MIAYIAQNTITNRAWDGNGFNIPGAISHTGKTLNKTEKAFLILVYKNVKFTEFELEPTAEEKSNSCKYLFN